MTDAGLAGNDRTILEAAGVSVHTAPIDRGERTNGSSVAEPLRTVTVRTEA